MNPQAERLNQTLLKNNALISNLLSEKGKAIYFPKEGIPAQTAEAKGKKINATVGVAMKNSQETLALSSIQEKIKLKNEDIFPYVSSYGLPELRKKWQELIYAKNNSLKSKISLPIVSSALTHGLSMAGYLFVNPGDEIIVGDKFWGNYRLIFENGYGGKLLTYHYYQNQGLDLISLKEKLLGAGKKKILLLNFPNNPTGYTPTVTEVQQIITIIKEAAETGKEVLVLVDDAYFGLVYEPGIFQESIFALLADLHPQVLAVKLDGPTKEDYAWGLRVGFITYGMQGITAESCQVLEEKTAGAIRGNISSVAHPSQSLVLQALNSPDYLKEKQELVEILRKRFFQTKTILQEKKYQEAFTPLHFNSGYFLCLQLKKVKAEEVRRLLLQKYDTGVVSLGQDLLRIAYSAVEEKMIKQLIENVYEAVREINN